MSIVSNHYPETIDACEFDAERPAAWSQQPTHEEITAMGEAAGQLLATPTARTRKPRAKPVRTITLLAAPANTAPAVQVLIDLTTVGTRGTRVECYWYWVTPIASDFGRAFLVEKSPASPGAGTEDDRYHVLLNGRESSCDCKGQLRHGGHSGRACKHLDGIKALVNRGKL